jgi:hypothetical protein
MSVNVKEPCIESEVVLIVLLAKENEGGSSYKAVRIRLGVVTAGASTSVAPKTAASKAVPNCFCARIRWSRFDSLS